MKKSLKLNLDDLQVDSFDATPNEASPRGTVKGHITTPGCGESEGICSGDESCLALCSAYCEPQTVPCTVQALTCPPPTQQQTCQATCQTCATCNYSACQGTCQSCVYHECYGTCDFQTKCWN